MWVVREEKEEVQLIFSFDFLPPSICFFVCFERGIKKGGVYVGEVMGKN